jgi:mRNA interferase HigB
MWVITRQRLIEFAARHPPARKSLADWYTVAKKASWVNLDEVREQYPHADLVTVKSKRKVVVFNVAGNNYRLVTAIHFNSGKVFILRVLTHAGYDKDLWKDQL